MLPPLLVVSYRNSTSNHNTDTREKNLRHVVSYRNSTSNHNLGQQGGAIALLYLIEILHQTTTIRRFFCSAGRLYLIEILHQTTTKRVANSLDRALYLIEILHQTTTLLEVSEFLLCCILSKFYIKPQLGWRTRHPWWCCILSKFYIKPQLEVVHRL